MMTSIEDYFVQVIKTALTLSAADMVRHSHLRQNVFARLVVYFIKRIVGEMNNANYDKLAIKAFLETIRGAIDTRLQTGRWDNE